MLDWSAESNRLLIFERVCTWALPLVASLGSMVVSHPAVASTRYDGNWSVVIVTNHGACDPTLRYGVQIANGAIISNASGIAAVQGRVSPNGAVRVTVRSGEESAEGAGRLAASRGAGAWRGRNGTCSGTWTAERRGYGDYARETEAPGRVVAQGYPASVAHGERRHHRRSLTGSVKWKQSAGER
jgi:hypothetical protein